MDPLTLSERLQILRDRYYLAVGQLLLLIAVGHSTSPVLLWVAISLLLALTVNKLIPFLR